MKTTPPGEGWIKCSTELPPPEEQVLFWLVTAEPKHSHEVRAARNDFQVGMFLPEDDPFLPLLWISHWKREATL